MSKIKGREAFINKILNYEKSVKAKAAEVSRYYADEVASYIKKVQPSIPNSLGISWTNRTGAAAAGMFTKAFNTAKSTGFFVAHSVDYGVYLELANDRQNAIILPVLKLFAPLYFADIKRIVESG